MHRSNARFWVLGSAIAAVFAVLAVVIAMSSDGIRTAYAFSTPTPTAGPPKPGDTGNLTGASDIWVPAGVYPNSVKGTGLFHCISYTTHDAGTNDMKTAANCVADTDIGDPNSQVPDQAGKTADGIPGPPPPPPYGTGVPAKGLGSYNPGTDSFTNTTCFSNIGGSLGPNIIAVVTVNTAKAQRVATGKMGGALKIYGAQSNAQCRSLTPTGAEYPFLGATLNIKIHPISDADNGGSPNTPSPWRTDEDLDYDNDGCTDEQELSKPTPANCGDDPWNPYDSNNASTDGSWYVLATARSADACQGGTSDTSPALYDCTGQPDRTFVPGAYYHCYAAVTAPVADLLCYIDFGPNTTAFPIAGYAPGPGTPVPVNPQQNATASGDGKSGAAPPGKTGTTAANPNLFADIDQKHAHLTWTVGASFITISGCFPNDAGDGPLGWVYVNAKINRYTWVGKATVYSFQTQANCEGGTPAGAGTTLQGIEATMQHNSPTRDTDIDGCPDKSELQDNPVAGGLRDPSNRWDYMNPLNNAVNRVPDISAVVGKFGVDDPNPLYDQKFDRGGSITGSNGWNLLPPNGTIRAADITAAVQSFGHDCGTGIDKTTPTPRPTATASAKISP
jgi:hypothetical protein